MRSYSAADVVAKGCRPQPPAWPSTVSSAGQRSKAFSTSRSTAFASVISAAKYEYDARGIFHASSVRCAASSGLMSVSVSVAPASPNFRTICSAMAPSAPVIKMVLPVRSIAIIFVSLAASLFAVSPLLHNSELLKCSHRAASFLNRFLYQLLAARFLQRLGEHFFRGFGGNHANSVNISEQNIPRAHQHSSNLDRHAKIHNLIARRRILPVRAKAEGRKIHFQNAFRVAHVAVHHRAGRAQFDRARAHQFAPQSVARRRTGIHRQFVAMWVLQGLM